MACQLIALDKKPGVRPIGIGETVRRIIAKVVLCVIGEDVQFAAGSLQLCAGQPSGGEAAVHAMREAFNDDDTEGMLLIDATNAFNSVNSAVALYNIQRLCPSFSTILINTYRHPACLFVDGDVLYSEEGTTQGDPLTMPFYALATVPLIQKLTAPVTQVWYADDAAACGKISALRMRWDQVSSLGPSFGYLPNAKKTWLVTKTQFCSIGKELFHDSAVNVTSDGRPHLGAPVGTSEYVERFTFDKISQWVSEVNTLSSIAISQPHAAYTCFTHGLFSRWLYVTCTVPDTSSSFQSLEKALLTKFIPALTALDPPGALQRSLFALPTRFGGLGIVAPDSLSSIEFSASMYVTAPLRSLILSQNFGYTADTCCSLYSRKLEIKQSKTINLSTLSKELFSKLTPTLQRAVTLAQEKGASSWLTALPVQEHGFSLHKTAFQDALALRYGWMPSCTPSHSVCGTNFSVDHALSRLKGGFPSIRHNEVRDITAELLSEVCHDVEIEPHLQPLSDERFQQKTANTQDDARLDIAMVRWSL